MPKTPVESVDSNSLQTPAQHRPRSPMHAAKPVERDFDADSWEPSLLERMLKANGVSRKDD